MNVLANCVDILPIRTVEKLLFSIDRIALCADFVIVEDGISNDLWPHCRMLHLNIPIVYQIEELNHTRSESQFFDSYLYQGLYNSTFLSLGFSGKNSHRALYEDERTANSFGQSYVQEPVMKSAKIVSFNQGLFLANFESIVHPNPSIYSLMTNDVVMRVILASKVFCWVWCSYSLVNGLKATWD